MFGHAILCTANNHCVYQGGTYAGNAVACAAAVAVADVFKEEKILENVQARSKELFAALEELRARPSVASTILDVRGEGLMVGIEFVNTSGTVPFSTSAPKKLSSRIAKRCQEKGLLILTTSVYEVIRFIPPLNISQADLKKGVEIFAEAVEEVVKEG